MYEVKKVKKEAPKTPHYTMWENSLYMSQLAWKNRKSVIFLMLGIACLTVIVNLLELFITPILLEKIELKTSLSSLLGWLLFFILSLLMTKGLLTYLKSNTLTGRLGLRMILITQMSQKIQKTSYPNLENTKFLEKYEAGMSSAMSNHSATEAFWETSSKITQSFLGFSLYLALLSNLNVFLAFIVVLTGLASYLFHQKINRKAQSYREEEEKITKELNYIQYKGEELAFAKDIRLFRMTPWLKEIYQQALIRYRGILSKKERYYSHANLVDLGMNFLRNGLAYAYLVYLSFVNDWLVSEFLLYFLAISGFSQWVQMILAEMSQLHRQSLDINHLREFLELEESFLFETGQRLPLNEQQTYEICLNNVSFIYPESSEATLKGLNLRIQTGESVAIVGLNGAGKTTLVKLICGFLDPTEGEVLLNGVNIKEYNRQDYYRHFSAVFQQFSILETSILENITQTMETSDMEKVTRNSQKAGLENLIAKLPQGMNTHLGKLVYEDGIELSGGQTQRLMLARALYKDAPMLILDEPTAALDPIAENDIYQKYHELTKNRLAVFISHRLASTRFCQRILYLEAGKIVEEGSHEVLLAQNGQYKRLFDVQRKYYQEEVEIDGRDTTENIS